MTKIYEKGAKATDKFNIRMPDGLRGRIKGHAVARKLSSNALILETLEAAFPAPVVPESINERLLLASKDILQGWSQILQALGEDPSNNDELQTLSKRLAEAENEVSP